jgi:PAS domain S-box-containing protein
MWLDMRTLILTNVISAIVAWIIVLGLWRQGRGRFAGLGWLAGDFALQTAAVLLIALRGLIPDWASIVLANALVLGGAILGYMGLERFVGKRSSPAFNGVILVVFVLIHAYFALLQPNLAVRNLNLSSGLLLIFLQCLWLLERRADPGLRPFTRGVGMVFGAFSVVNVVRIVEFFVGTHGATNYLAAGPFDRGVLVAYQVLWLLLTYSLILMVNKRLLAEVKTQEEKFSKAFLSAPYALTLTRMPDGRIMEVNKGFLNMTGYEPAEVVGYKTTDLRLWEYPADRDRVLAALTRDGKMHGAEFIFRKKSGELLTGLFSAEIILFSGQPFVLSSISDITDRKQAELEREKLIRELQTALNQVRQLSGLLPICAYCKKVRDDRGYWTQIEAYVRNHSEAEFSHGVCPDCEAKHFPEYATSGVGDEAPPAGS